MEAVIGTESRRERLACAAEAEPDTRNLLLQPDEADLLDRILSNYLVELHSEIGHTDRYELRQALKQDRVVVAGLVAQLRAPAAGSAATRGA